MPHKAPPECKKRFLPHFLSVLHLLSKEGYKLEYAEMVNHGHANQQTAKPAFPFYVKFVSDKVTMWAFDRMFKHMNASSAYLVYEYDVSREAQYIDANRAAPFWNYDRQCHDSLQTELVDLSRFCAISKRVQQIQGKNIVYEVKRSESRCTSRYMNCPHYVCLFEPLAEDGAYTQFWCGCGLAVRVRHPCRHYFAVLHHRSSSVGFYLGLFNQIFVLKQFQTAAEVLISAKCSAKCSSQCLPLPTVQVPVAIHAKDDEIMLTDISSWADLPGKTKREQIVRSLGNLQSRMRQYIANVDRVATHLSDQGQDARAFLEEEGRLLNQFVDMRASSTEVHVAGAQAPRSAPLPVAAKRTVQPTVRKAAKPGDGTNGATKGRRRGRGRGSTPPLREQLNAALDLSDALTTVKQAPGSLSA